MNCFNSVYILERLEQFTVDARLIQSPVRIQHYLLQSFVSAENQLHQSKSRSTKCVSFVINPPRTQFCQHQLYLAQKNSPVNLSQLGKVIFSDEFQCNTDQLVYGKSMIYQWIRYGFIMDEKCLTIFVSITIKCIKNTSIFQSSRSCIKDH